MLNIDPFTCCQFVAVGKQIRDLLVSHSFSYTQRINFIIYARVYVLYIIIHIYISINLTFKNLPNKALSCLVDLELVLYILSIFSSSLPLLDSLF